MIDPKPTAGPWRVDSAVGADWVYGADGTFVAKVGSSPGLTREQVSANAALIARAPDLLAERDELRAEVERMWAERKVVLDLVVYLRTHIDRLNTHPQAVVLLNSAEAALARMEGKV